jgi:hypothetical protein
MNARSILVALFFFVFALNSRAQAVMNLTGEPFSATWTMTTESAGIVTTTKVVAARSSDGSVYCATYKGGIIDWIEIDDVPHEKRIEIHPQTKQYTESVPRPQGKWITRTSEQQHAVLESWNKPYTREAPNQRKDSTPIGVKIIDGMTIFGSHYVRTRDDVRTMDGVTWLSDLGFIYSSRSESLTDKKITSLGLTEIKRGEPDASLFIVPSDYALIRKVAP